MINLIVNLLGLSVSRFPSRCSRLWTVDHVVWSDDSVFVFTWLEGVFHKLVSIVHISTSLLEQADSWHPWPVMGDTCHFAFYDGPWICPRRGASYERPFWEWCNRTAMTRDPLLLCCIRTETFKCTSVFSTSRNLFFVSLKAQGHLPRHC